MTITPMPHAAETKPPAQNKRAGLVRKSTGTPSVPTKVAQITKLLTRSRGATIAELSTATGWQSHSVRALLSDLRKKGKRLVREERKSGEHSYRIEAAEPDLPAAVVAIASATQDR